MLTDDDLRARLTEAFHEHADPVASQGVRTDGLYARGRRRRRRQVVTRAGAALAVVAVAAGAWTLRPQPAVYSPTAGTTQGQATAGVLLAAAVAHPQPAAAAQAGLPPYYVVTGHNEPTAVVRSTATGAALATVPLPAGTDPKTAQISAAANDRTFVLALARGLATRFYRLTVTPAGHTARLSPLAVPALPPGEYVNAVAVSPDGREFAVAVQSSTDRDGSMIEHGLVRVVTVATGAVRTWSTVRSGMPQQISWTANGRDLGFFWTDDASRATTAAGLWVLDTAAPGRDLLSGHRILPAYDGTDDVQTALLSPDGTTAIASVTYDGTRHLAAGTVTGGIVEVSIRTGRPLRILLAEHATRSADPEDPGWYTTPCQLPAIDASGQHLLVSCDRFGRLDRARFTPLPGSAPQVSVAAGW